MGLYQGMAIPHISTEHATSVRANQSALLSPGTTVSQASWKRGSGWEQGRGPGEGTK